MMTDTEILPYDGVKFFVDIDDQRHLLTEAFESGDRAFIAQALGTVARARGMTAMAEETGIKRQALYTALSADGNPTLDSLLKVLAALKLELRVQTVA
jgi:probable addiction module antidote protein